MSGGGSKLSISSDTRTIIQTLKEIKNSHSEEEIYAILEECSMDPDEAAQKLLSQDTFHEVKRKRDRKKENMNNKESGDSRWRPGTQVRGNRGSRASFSPRHTSNDANGGKNSGPGKDNGTNQMPEKGAGPSLPAFLEKSKETSLSTSSGAIVANGSPNEAFAATCEMQAAVLPEGSAVKQHEVNSSPTSAGMLGGVAPPVDANTTPTMPFGKGDAHGEPMPVGTIKQEVGSHHTTGELDPVIAAEKSAQEMGGTMAQGKMASKPHGGGTDSSRPSSTSGHGGSSSSRPSSNYSSRSQQIVGPQKVGLNKEWKPKTTSTNIPQGSVTAGSCDVPNVTEASAASRPASSVLESEESTSKLQKKLEELHLPPRQHVIIPNHIHVPESERTKLSFGSFDATFGLPYSYANGPESDKSSTPLSETSQVIEESVVDQAASNQNALVTAEEEAYSDHPQSALQLPGNLAGEGDVSSNPMLECNESKQETSGGHQYSVVHTSPSYSSGFVPPMLGSQVAPFENSESPAHDVSRLPSFVVSFEIYVLYLCYLICLLQSFIYIAIIFPA
uniref:Uncharacterized protein MANES_12G064000 n=1 Tax=Rhizophora mucronata TaxID=61149 RepID=A0A2P2LZ28_RHIMU